MRPEARFIDLESFQSQNLNLAVRVFNSKHTHENIAAAITEILGEFELDAEVRRTWWPS